MRHDVFESLASLPVSYFDRFQTGDIISTITYDIDTVNQSLSNDMLQVRFPQLRTKLDPEVAFITSQELEDMYPDLTPKEREYRITKDKGAVFLMQIGDKLKSGMPHDGRAPDYDDWNLNGDLLFWLPSLQKALEISSMGIRVDAEALDRQLKLSGFLQLPQVLIVAVPAGQPVIVDLLCHFQLCPKIGRIHIAGQITGTIIYPSVFVNLTTEKFTPVGSLFP